MNPFSQLPTILPPRVPSTSEEFVVAMAVKDLNFFQGLSEKDRRGLLIDDSRTLFRVGPLIFIVVLGQDGILFYDELLKEHDELKERCEALE